MDIFSYIFLVLIFVTLAVGQKGLADMRRRLATLSRIEGKLDLLLQHANLNYDPYTGVPANVVEAVTAGEKIQAIKLYRQTAGVGLKEAKDFIEALQRKVGL
jgi:hypothetical protein